MSHAMYFATRNFRNTYKMAYEAKTPFYYVRKATRGLSDKAALDNPTADIYRHGPGGHVARVFSVGPRWGAKAGALTAGAVHGLLSQAKGAVTTKSDAVEPGPLLTSKTSLTEKLSGVAGTLLGGLVGLSVRTLDHLAVTAGYFGAMALGAGLGAIPGVLVGAMYGLHVLFSDGMRESLRQRRAQDNEAGKQKVLELFGSDIPDAPVAAVVSAPPGLKPVRVR